MAYISKSDREIGFTLVEIAIVIVIIGLLTAGVAKGVELLRTTKLQGVTRDMDKIRLSFIAFKNRFGHLPGDFDEAVGFGLCTGCNGDGDGKIDISESPNVWVHLESAEILAFSTKRRVSAMPSTATCAQLDSDGEQYFEVSDYNNPTPARWEHDEENKLIHINGCTTTTAITTTSLQQFEGTLTAEQASFIDTKVDDGVANTGAVLAAKSATSANIGCTRANTATLSNYDLDTQEKGCSLIFSYKDW